MSIKPSYKMKLFFIILASVIIVWTVIEFTRELITLF